MTTYRMDQPLPWNFGMYQGDGPADGPEGDDYDDFQGMLDPERFIPAHLVSRGEVDSPEDVDAENEHAESQRAYLLERGDF